MTTIASPIYSTIQKGPRVGAKVINWAATAEDVQQQLNASRRSYDDLQQMIVSRNRALSALYSRNDSLRHAGVRAMSHWSSIFWPKSLWTAFSNAGVSK